MAWYGYILQFLSAALLTNSVPHFVQGVSGNPFQSPFGKPPGVGESSPVSNVIWGFANFVGGALLFAHFPPQGYLGWGIVGAGSFLMAVQLGAHFGKVRAAARASERRSA